jgi:hypothetical protein
MVPEPEGVPPLEELELALDDDVAGCKARGKAQPCGAVLHAPAYAALWTSALRSSHLAIGPWSRLDEDATRVRLAAMIPLAEAGLVARPLLSLNVSAHAGLAIPFTLSEGTSDSVAEMGLGPFVASCLAIRPVIVIRACVGLAIEHAVDVKKPEGSDLELSGDPFRPSYFITAGIGGQ